MTAEEIIEDAKHANVSLSLSESGNISAKGRQPDIEQLLPIIRQNKHAILRLLRGAVRKWTPQDWLEYFDERAGIAEFDGGLPRDQAEVRALSCCVGEWLHHHLVRSPVGRCDLCGRSDGMLLPFLTDYAMKDPGHTWLHESCSDTWHQQRKAAAIAALNDMGIGAGR